MKKLLLLILCLLFSIGLVACDDGTDTPPSVSNGEIENSGNESGGSENGGNEEGEQPEQPSEEETTITDLSNGAKGYALIYPKSPTAETSAAVTQLYDKLTNGLSITMAKANDAARPEKTQDRVYKILVGKTNYTLSDQAFADIRYHDFKIVANDTCLAIAAHTADGYAAALQWLEQNTFSKISNRESITGTVVKQSLVSQYPMEKWTVGGLELSNYKFVYADGIDQAQMLDFRNEFAQSTGYFLDIASDVEAGTYEYEILIGNTNRAESKGVAVSALNYIVKAVNKKLVIKTGGPHSFELLMTDFDDLVMQQSTKLEMGADFEQKGDFFDDPNDTSKISMTDVRVISANVQANLDGYDVGVPEDFDFDRRLEIFFATLDYYQPTVVGVQEFCMSWYNGFEKYQNADKWGVLKFQNPVASWLKNEYVFTTVMYRNDLLDLIESGTIYYTDFTNWRCRCITWAVLKDKVTGKEFCFVSTHMEYNNQSNFDQLSAFVNQKAQSYPVIVTGDFNTGEELALYKSFLSKSNSIDTMYNTFRRLNTESSYHGWGSSNCSAYSIDHIISTKKVNVLKFETLIYNQQIYASDHAFLMADVTFSA